MIKYLEINLKEICKIFMKEVIKLHRYKIMINKRKSVPFSFSWMGRFSIIRIASKFIHKFKANLTEIPEIVFVDVRLNPKIQVKE